MDLRTVEKSKGFIKRKNYTSYASNTKKVKLLTTNIKESMVPYFFGKYQWDREGGRDGSFFV